MLISVFLYAQTPRKYVSFYLCPYFGLGPAQKTENGENPSGKPDELRHNHFHTPTFRVSDQHLTIITRIKYRNGICRCQNEYCKYDQKKR